MSPAIMFCGASDDGERFAGLFNMRQILLSASGVFVLLEFYWSCARDFAPR